MAEAGYVASQSENHLPVVDMSSKYPLSLPIHYSLLQHHCNMPLSISLRFARSFSLARMRPTVPSIDFKPFLYGSPGDRQRIASEIDEALGSVGFIQLHNHGIEQYRVDECFQWVSPITLSCNTSAPVALNADSTTNCRANVFSLFQSPGRGQCCYQAFATLRRTSFRYGVLL